MSEDWARVDLERRKHNQGEKWRLYPPDVLPVWVADMDFDVAPPIRAALADALDRSDWGYPVDPARCGIAEAYCERMASHFDFEPDPSQVELLCVVVLGIYIALLQLTEAGDGVLVQTPIYPPFLQALRETGRRLVEIPLTEESDAYGLDLAAIRAACDSSTRVLLFCNPHNPAGRVFTRAELEGLAELVLERDLIVLSDEIHADLVFKGHRHIPFASLSPEVAARTVTFYSASKAFNVAGLRCAVAAFGDSALQERFRALPHHVRGGLSQPGILATRAAWGEGEPWLAHILGVLEENRDYVVAEIPAALPGATLYSPEATYLAWIDCRKMGLSKSAYQHFLERARVAFGKGEAFGTPGRDFVRLNFATSREILAEVIRRCADSLQG